MTKTLFEDVVKQLYDRNFVVVASVCDLGLSNQKFLREMGVYENDDDLCFVTHPSNDALKIFFLADCPHMLKLFRNHMIDQGITLNGYRVLPEIWTTVINLIKR
jgi:hypothetical protein